MNFAVFKFTQEPKVCYPYIKSLFLGYAFKANFLGLRVDFAVSVKILSSKRRERCQETMKRLPLDPLVAINYL